MYNTVKPNIMVQMYKTVQPICKYLLDDNNYIKVLNQICCDHSNFVYQIFVFKKKSLHLMNSSVEFSLQHFSLPGSC